MSRGEALAMIIVGGALRGDYKYTTELLKRVWPATEKREITGADGRPFHTGTSL
jgi:hypothetical protein